MLNRNEGSLNHLEDLEQTAVGLCLPAHKLVCRMYSIKARGCLRPVKVCTTWAWWGKPACMLTGSSATCTASKRLAVLDLREWAGSAFEWAEAQIKWARVQTYRLGRSVNREDKSTDGGQERKEGEQEAHCKIALFLGYLRIALPDLQEAGQCDLIK
eukprot:1141017-Pelagomonas_calceolata.AAC.9